METSLQNEQNNKQPERVKHANKQNTEKTKNNQNIGKKRIKCSKFLHSPK